MRMISTNLNNLTRKKISR